MWVGLRRQVLALSVGLALCAALGRTSLGVLVLSYALAVLLLGAVRAQDWTARPFRGFEWLLLAAVAVPACLAIFRARADWIDDAGLHGITSLLADRLRLEQLPAIAPPLVTSDRAQTFYIHAKPNAEVRVQFGAQSQTHARELSARALTAGLYRVDYDPRRDGALLPSDGPLPVHIRVDRDDTTRELLAATPLAHPRWLARSPDGERAATVSEETDELVIVSARGLERRVPVGDQPSDCAFVSAGIIAVTHREDPALLYIDAGTGARVSSLTLGATQVRLAVSPDGSRLAVARAGRSPELVLIDASTRGVTARVTLASEPDWLAFGADAATLVYTSRRDASLHRLRADAGGDFREDARLVLGRAAVTLGRARDGRHLFVAVTDYAPTRAANLANHFVDDQILTLEVARFAIVHSERTARRSPRQSKPGDVDRGLSPMAIVEAGDGSLLVTFAGSDEIWRMRDGAPEPDVIDLGEAGLYAPHGIAELRDGTLIVSSPAAGALGLLTHAAAKPTLLRLAPDDAYLLAHNPLALERRLGERGFYEGTRSGISCQSCHLHADSDESAHNLGTHHLLPTLSVRGVLGTGPYLRDGSFARVEDLDHVAQTLYRGYLRRAPGRAHTLGAYVAALPRRQRARDDAFEPLEEARVQRGATAFVRAECPTCHAFPAFSNLAQQRTRMLFPDRTGNGADAVLDTPSLLSLALRPPYLNDGRAHDVSAVIERENRANRHGDTARLSAAERSDLVAFLESL